MNFEELTKDKATFLNYAKSVKSFPNPSIYFHMKVIDSYRGYVQKNDYKGLLNDDLFIERVYATVSLWGMAPMTQSARIKKFEDFKKEIDSNKKELLMLHEFKLHELNDTKKDYVRKLLADLWDNFKVMESDSQIVGNSKTLHHLLPDLLPPIDRRHALKFFKINNLKNEKEVYLKIFDCYYSICKKLSLNEDDYKKLGGFHTSIPKLIDNAIIGFPK